MVFTFIDLSGDFIEACQKRFGNGSRYFTGNIEVYMPSGRRIYYISPANSLGFMDGGIDAFYSIRMFPGLEKRVKKAIKDKSSYKTLLGRPYLPIGKALVVPISQQKLGECYLVCAPTMLLPQKVRGTQNAYYAMIATLQAIHDHGYDHNSDELIIPGLCCGYGGFTRIEATKQIYNAIQDFRQISLDLDKILAEQPNYYENSEFKEIYSSSIVIQ